MNNTERDLIEIIGLCNTEDFDLDTYPYWTQISIPETVFLPEQKPDMEQIDSLKIDVEIIKTKVIKTPISTNAAGAPNNNWEGKFVTGRKLIIDGKLCQTVTYVADTSEQSVHTAHFAVPFSAYIVLANPVPDFTPDDPLDLVWTVKTCVEDAFILDICKRGLFKNITLLLQAIPSVKISPCNDCTMEVL